METQSKYVKVDLFAVAPGVWGMKDVFVNVYAILNPAENNWFLVDAGLKWSAPKIKRMAELLFGAGSKPAAIILTHGHFDHVGALAQLAAEWDVQVYAHHLEMPYLTGISSYPPADPTVGGGLMADLSFVYPKSPINIEDRVISLPQGGLIPGLSEWKFIHTPGHAPGHISLFRESDKVLIAGDAIVTTKQESALFVALQLKKLSGPPKYFTCDWSAAATSVRQIADLEPEVIATGHGRPMRGAGMRKSLHNLANNFYTVAFPKNGRYAHQPAVTNDSGIVSLPPKNKNATASPTLKLLGIGAGLLLTAMLLGDDKKKKKGKAEKNLKRPDKQGKLEKLAMEKIASAQKPVKKEITELKKQGKDEFEEMFRKNKKKLNELSDDGKDQYDDLKDSTKKGITELKKSGKDKYDDVKDTAKKGFGELKKSGKDEYKELRDSGKKGLAHAKDHAKTAKTEWKDLKHSGKKEINQLKKTGIKEFEKLKKSGEHKIDDLKETLIDNISHLKFPLRKGIRKIKKLTR